MLTRKPWRGVRWLPASVWIVFATTFVNRAGTMVVPFMVLYVPGTWACGRPSPGWRSPCTASAGWSGGPIAGRLCDRLGAFAVLRGALVLSGLILLAYPLASRFGTFLAITFVWSLVAESVRPATMAALTSVVRPSSASGGRRQPARHQPRDERGAGGRRLSRGLSRFPCSSWWTVRARLAAVSC